MLGIILTGHGHFATGLLSSINLIAGKQEKVAAIDFEEGMSSDTLLKKLREAVQKLDVSEGVVVFTDIPGGTPFNQSVLLSQETSSIRVLAGTNLPALMDGLFSRETDVDEFVEKVLSSGKNGLVSYKKKTLAARNENEEDGI